MTQFPKWTRFLPLVSIALFLGAPSARAGDGCGADGQILDRADLLARLGANAVTEDFETFNIDDFQAVVLEFSCLDEATITNGQGPGLVEPGATYCTSSRGVLQWNGNQYFERTTKTFLSNTEGLVITYTQPVTAMGLDVSAYVGYGYTGTATIYDTTNGVLGTVGFTLASGGPERFFVGWADAGGIGRVELFEVEHEWSPKIDDHVYGECGNTPPEAFCFGNAPIGSGDTVPCPCGNSGAAGNGCANSDHPGGANLSASGDASLAADTLVLTVTDQHAGFLQLFIQGDAETPHTNFGDGSRCIDGNLKRTFRVVGAHSTTVAAPSANSIPPAPATISGQSAAKGDMLSPGDIRGYQVYYRDADPNFCPSPTGSTFNVTNAVRVFWGP